MNTIKPEVSVVMPVFNRQVYVSDAISSILNQSFADFEFIIVDDGSTDNSYNLISTFKDSRIKPIKLKENRGNYYARNLGMSMAVGKYICVMDSDDIALPDRIQIQHDFMESNKNFGICGSYVKIMNSVEIITAPVDYDEIKVWSMSNIMFRHPTVFIRKDFLKKYNLWYNDSYRYAADYDFLAKAAHLFPVTNIDKVLLEYRKHPEQISSAKRKEQTDIAYLVMVSQLQFFNIKPTERENHIHLAFMNRYPVKSINEFNELKTWANFLMERNLQFNNYSPEHLAWFFKSLLKNIYKNFEQQITKEMSVLT